MPLPPRSTSSAKDASRYTFGPRCIVERESQKGIVIGHRGETLRKIGTHARTRLEALLGEQVYLETWVKVLPGWRRNAAHLARFGFPVPDDEVE